MEMKHLRIEFMRELNNLGLAHRQRLRLKARTWLKIFKVTFAHTVPRIFDD